MAGRYSTTKWGNCALVSNGCAFGPGQVDLDVPAPVITLALQARLVSRQDESYTAKLLAAMRNQFGGHAVKKA